MNSVFFFDSYLHREVTNPETMKELQDYVKQRQSRPTLNVYPENPWVSAYEFVLLSPLEKQALFKKKNQ